MNELLLTKFIKSQSLSLGFDKVGIAPIQNLPHSRYFRKWIEEDLHGNMRYLAENIEKRLDVLKLCPEAKSVIVVAHNYYNPHSQPKAGKISRYAWGRDYHKVVKKKLKKLWKLLLEKKPNLQGKISVDTLPIMEKLWAEAAGIGWQGKNSCIITREYGSWVFLGLMVVNCELIYDSPSKNLCGNCQRCMESCPQKAILAPHILDARKCISYLTIEMWDQEIPPEYDLNGWIFGCDICQEVCPWNRKFAKIADEKDYFPREGVLSPLSYFSKLDEENFLLNFQGSPIRRAKWKNFMRNIRKCENDLDHTTSI